MQNFDIYLSETQSNTAEKFSNFGYFTKPYSKEIIINAHAMLLSDDLETLIESQSEYLFRILIRKNPVTQSDIPSLYFLPEDFNQQEFKCCVSMFKEWFQTVTKVGFKAYRNHLVNYHLSGNIHDLFSHLNNISTRVQFLDMVVKGNEHIERAVEITLNQTEQITRILRNLQQFSKTDFNTERFNSNIGQCIDDVLTMSKNRFIKDKIHIEYTPPKSPVFSMNCDTNILKLFFGFYFQFLGFLAGHKTIHLSINTESDIIICAYFHSAEELTSFNYHSDYLTEDEFYSVLTSLDGTITRSYRDQFMTYNLSLPKGAPHV